MNPDEQGRKGLSIDEKCQGKKIKTRATKYMDESTTKAGMEWGG